MEGNSNGQNAKSRLSIELSNLNVLNICDVKLKGWEHGPFSSLQFKSFRRK